MILYIVILCMLIQGYRVLRDFKDFIEVSKKGGHSI